MFVNLTPHEIVLDGGPKYLPKGTVTFTYPVDCLHCDHSVAVNVGEDVPDGFLWIELEGNWICDDCWKQVY